MKKEKKLYNIRIMNNKKILLLVDPLNDFADKSGSLYVPNGEKIIPEINKITNENKFDIIILIQDWHPENHKSFAINNNEPLFSKIDLNGIEQVMWPVHCVQNTWGSEPHKDLINNWDHIVKKGTNINVDSYSAFFENDSLTKTDIFEILRNIKKTDEIYIVGLATEYCVKYTALDAIKFHDNVYIFQKAIAGINDSDVTEAINEMINKGINLI